MNIEKVMSFMEKHAGTIILVQAVSALAMSGLFFYVGYRILKHFGIF